MLNASLAVVAVGVWIFSYVLFFARDLRRWWRMRHTRRQHEAVARERAIRAYAAWVRNIPPPRSRAPIMPVPVPMPMPQTSLVPVRTIVPVHTGVVVPFPQRRRLTQP